MKHEKIEFYFFVTMLLGGAATLFVIGIMLLFASSFGELASGAVNALLVLLKLPSTIFSIGLTGWFFAKFSSQTHFDE